MTIKIDFHSIERHVINENNIQEYILILPNMLKQASNWVEFHLDRPNLDKLFKSIGFVEKKCYGLVKSTYTNNQNCIVELGHAFINGQYTDYYVFYQVDFTKSDAYPENFQVRYQNNGAPLRIRFTDNRLLKSLLLKSISYDIDMINLQITKITYTFNDGRKYQKCIKGCILTITETPIKIVDENGINIKNINIYDVFYFRPMITRTPLSLSEIISTCGLRSSKLVGTHYTQFLQMYKMFNKREQDIISMVYI